MTKQPKRLYRSETDKQLAGVCGGIGEYFAIDSTLIRLGWILMTILTGILPGIIGYVIAAAVIPRPGQTTTNNSKQ